MVDATPETNTASAARTRRANELGPSGGRVAENIKQQREALPLTTEQLAERVTAFGRPMRANTITKIEKKQRRVDVDDLVALALALRTSVNALLLPTHGDGTASVELAEEVAVSAADAWQWADGDKPHDKAERDEYGDLLLYRLRSRPEWERDVIRQVHNQGLQQAARQASVGAVTYTTTKEGNEWVSRSPAGVELWRVPAGQSDDQQ
ncbi:helix-turn-helix domain-containing protein [Streptomyces rochei]|uniref:helix-turn-helix domain-containing protein n=1 Tax=Streptomyces rochei TaxID=1928 RepID=UPI00367932ED